MNSEIKIRHRELSDLDDIYEILQGKNYVSGTLQLPHSPTALIKKRIESSPEGFYSLVAVINDKVVGEIGLFTNSRPRRKHVGGIGMGVHDDYNGRGVGSALMAACCDMADNWLNITRLELEVFTDNAPAIALYKKFDFVEEGVKRAFAFRAGKYEDVLCMARFRPGFTFD
ncbi:MAG: GNAT family N-acetyltransferase [Chloroflexota bacterium]